MNRRPLTYVTLPIALCVLLFGFRGSIRGQDETTGWNETSAAADAQILQFPNEIQGESRINAGVFAFVGGDGAAREFLRRI